MSKKLSRSFLLSMGLLLLFFLLAVLAPILPIENPGHFVLEREFETPNFQEWLGRGENGISLLSHVIWGARLSLFVSALSVILSSTIGTVVGFVVAHHRGLVERVFLVVADCFSAFPGILLVLCSAVLLGASVYSMVFSIVLASWVGYARLIRSTVLSVKEKEYVKAAEVLGVNSIGLYKRYYLPNSLSSLLVKMSYGLGAAILTESSLSFLGVGASLDQPSWGRLIDQGRHVFLLAPHALLLPGVCLALVLLGINYFSDSLRELLDKKNS